VKKSKKWTRVERFERLWLVLSALLRKKIFISPENGKNLLLSRENKKNKDFGKRRRKFPHSILPLSFYTKKLNKMSSSMSASSAALGSKLALHKVRFFASFFRCSLLSFARESFAIPFSEGGEIFFSPSFSRFISPTTRGLEIFQGARGDKNARKRPQTRIFIRAEDQSRFVCSFGSRIGGFARV
jgi:hypothetical protein